MSDEEEVDRSSDDGNAARRADLDQPDDDVPSERRSSPGRSGDSRRGVGGAADPGLRSAAVNAVAAGDDDDTIVDGPPPDDLVPAAAAPAEPRSTSATPGAEESGGSNRRFVVLAVAAGILLAVGFFLALPKNQSSGLEGDALPAAGAVEIQDSRRTTVVTDPQRPATTATPASTTPPTAAPTTAVPETTQPTSTPSTPSTTAPPTPANLQVIDSGRDGAGNMLLLAGSQGAVVINNIGGQPGTYTVLATGAVSLGPGASGTVLGGTSVQVAIIAADTSPGGSGPHGMVLVSGPNGVLAEIPVVVS